MANLGSQTSAPGTKWVAYVLAGALAALVVLVLSRSTLPGPQQGRAGVILRSPAPRTLRRLQARFTLADLLAAARLTGYLNCTGASRNEMYASSPGSDLVIKTAEVACAAPEVDSTPPRSPYEHCCQHPVYIRPGTSDAPTFEEIAVRHVFYFLYAFPPFRDAPPKYILDAGGNVGYAALQFSMLFPSATIITLEPNPDNFAQLSKNVAGRKNVIPLNVGLWGWSAHVDVVHSDGENAYVFQEVPAGKGGTPALSVVDIMTRYNIPTFDIVKIDIEGAEAAVFDPRSDISWMRPNSTQLMSIEVHGRYARHFKTTDVEMRARVDRATGGYVHRYDGRELDLYFGQFLVD